MASKTIDAKFAGEKIAKLATEILARAEWEGPSVIKEKSVVSLLSIRGDDNTTVAHALAAHGSEEIRLQLLDSIDILTLRDSNGLSVAFVLSMQKEDERLRRRMGRSRRILEIGREKWCVALSFLDSEDNEACALAHDVLFGHRSGLGVVTDVLPTLLRPDPSKG